MTTDNRRERGWIYRHVYTLIHQLRHGDWNKRAQVAQVVGVIAIPISVIVLIYSIYQFGVTQRNAAQQELNQQRQATLNSYLNEMSNLILNDHLLTSRPGAPVRTLAIAQTDTAVRNLDGKRKGTLIRYLWEAHLITGLNPIVTLYQVDLSGANFSGANLGRANLSTNDLAGADFANANPNGADFHEAVLTKANLSDANLSCIRGSLGISQGLLDLESGNISCSSPSSADLSGATLRGADLRGADLCGADLAGADLTGADLGGARYNPEPFRVHVNGAFVTVQATQWPNIFRPKKHGAVPVTAVDCLHVADG
jgi:Pentapeptide repeats (8 copies)